LDPAAAWQPPDRYRGASNRPLRLTRMGNCRTAIDFDRNQIFLFLTFVAFATFY
jgi:hypothetical protein